MGSKQPDYPTPPVLAPAYAIDPLHRQDPEMLRKIADYAEKLAAAKEIEAEAELAEEAVTDEDDDRVHPEDVEQEVDDDVPKKATLTTKNIDGNTYYYWQWREGDEIKSEYHRPVSPKR